MSAICDASRNGVAIKYGTLYCTTFPCHLCAKHIVASGIALVVYLEPYPKSYAIKLHSDSITLNKTQAEKVVFRPFMGIAPSRYRDLFEKGKRKSSRGEAQKWESDPKRPLIQDLFPATEKAEQWVIVRLAELIKKEREGEGEENGPS
jgi:cytidine deaminase